MVPAVGNSSPAIMRSVVVLPQPEGPSRQRNWPSSTVKLADLTAWNVPKDLSSASTLICAIAPYARTFDTMVNITVPNRVVANDQEYSVRENGCISITTPAAMIAV